MFFPEKSFSSVDQRRLENGINALTSPLELGKAYLRLAHIYKHLGPEDDRHPFTASADAAQKAVGYLRQTDDRKALAAALRASVVAFVTDTHEQANSWLVDSLRISEEENDQSGLAWSHHAIATHSLRIGNTRSHKEHQAKAIEIWKMSVLPAEKGMGYFLSALHGVEEQEKAEDYLRAATAFHEAKCYKNAATAYNMSVMCGEPFWDRTVVKVLLRQAIRVAQWAGNDSLVAGCKKRLRKLSKKS